MDYHLSKVNTNCHILFQYLTRPNLQHFDWTYKGDLTLGWEISFEVFIVTERFSCNKVIAYNYSTLEANNHFEKNVCFRFNYGILHCIKQHI